MTDEALGEYVDENFWKRITRQAAYSRRKRGVLLTLFLGFGFAGFILLAFARAAFNHTGQLQWPFLGIAFGCIGLAILIRVYFERS